MWVIRRNYPNLALLRRMQTRLLPFGHRPRAARHGGAHPTGARPRPGEPYDEAAECWIVHYRAPMSAQVFLDVTEGTEQVSDSLAKAMIDPKSRITGIFD